MNPPLGRRGAGVRAPFGSWLQEEKGMGVRRRMLAAASVAALAGSLAVAVGTGVQAAQSPPGTGVTFTSQAGVVSYTMHTVTPGGRTVTGSAAGGEGLSALSPKGNRNRNSRSTGGAGVN